MPFKYKTIFETVEDIENNYGNEGHYPMPPGITSPGKAIRLEAAREREARLQYLEYERRTRPWYMKFDIDMNNEYDIKATIEILMDRLRHLQNKPIIVPDPKYF